MVWDRKIYKKGKVSVSEWPFSLESVQQPSAATYISHHPALNISLSPHRHGRHLVVRLEALRHFYHALNVVLGEAPPLVRDGDLVLIARRLLDSGHV